MREKQRPKEEKKRRKKARERSERLSKWKAQLLPWEKTINSTFRALLFMLAAALANKQTLEGYLLLCRPRLKQTLVRYKVIRQRRDPNQSAVHLINFYAQNLPFRKLQRGAAFYFSFVFLPFCFSLFSLSRKNRRIDHLACGWASVDCSVGPSFPLCIVSVSFSIAD